MNIFSKSKSKITRNHNDYILDSIKYYEQCLNHCIKLIQEENVHNIYQKASLYRECKEFCKKKTLKADKNWNELQNSEFFTIAKEMPPNKYTEALEEVASRHNEKLRQHLPRLALELNSNYVGGYDKYIKKNKKTKKTKKRKTKKRKK